MGRSPLEAGGEALRASAVSRTMRPRARIAGLAALLAALLPGVATGPVGCGRDTTKTGTPSPRAESAQSGPLARWRRGSEPTASGRPVVIEAERDCRVRL